MNDVGVFRFCPSCARLASNGEYVVTDVEEIRCTGCDRPWVACPCEPIREVQVPA